MWVKVVYIQIWYVGKYFTSLLRYQMTRRSTKANRESLHRAHIFSLVRVLAVNDVCDLVSAFFLI